VVSRKRLLGLVRQIKDVASDRKLLVDFLLGEASVGDVEELTADAHVSTDRPGAAHADDATHADRLGSVPELLGKRLLASGGVELAEVEVDKVGPLEVLLRFRQGRVRVLGRGVDLLNQVGGGGDGHDGQRCR
jgi:hypothetical protein